MHKTRQKIQIRRRRFGEVWFWGMPGQSGFGFVSVKAPGFRVVFRVRVRVWVRV